MRSWREFDCPEWRMTDSCSGKTTSWCELEFNDLLQNIHLYLRLNHGTASEHLKYSAHKLLWCFMMFLWLSWGLTTTQQRIWIGLVSPLPDPQKMTGADTDPEYRIDASLPSCRLIPLNRGLQPCSWIATFLQISAPTQIKHTWTS